MKSGFSNKKQQKQNESVYYIYYERLHDYCLSLFKWTGFPFPDQVNREICLYLNELLYRGDQVAYIKVLPESHRADNVLGYIPILGAATPSDARTWWGGSDTWQIITETGTFSANRADLALCQSTPTNRPLIAICSWYALQLAQAEQSIRVNMINQNTPAIIQSPPGQELTYANAFEQIAGFKPVVYGRENLLGDEKNGIFAYRYLQPAQYVADKLEMLKHDILNDFFNELGISAKSIEKKAQLISDELNIDFTSNSLAKNTFLDCRIAFCDEIKAVYGDEVSCEYNVDVINAVRDLAYENIDNRGVTGTAGAENSGGGTNA